jgi:hypothetical protein
MLYFVSVFLTLASSARASHLPTRAAKIPMIAHVCGIVVGQDTIQHMEHQLGTGAYMPGQHPTGGRAWFIDNLHILVNADGFDYDSNGEIVDKLSMSIGERQSDRRLKPSTAPASRIAFLGGVLPGMSNQEVFKRFKPLLPAPKAVIDPYWTRTGNTEFRWQVPGKSTNDALGQTRFTSWTACLLFHNATLVEIEVSCS